MLVSKLDAARRQLDCAVEMWFTGGDPVSLHTLAGAAHQVIHDLNQHEGGKELLFDSGMIREDRRKEWIDLLKRDMNDFKHADLDPDEVMDFDPLKSEIFIMFSVLGLDVLGQKLNRVESAFELWFSLHHPDLLTEKGTAGLLQRCPVEHLGRLRQIPKDEFFKAYMLGGTKPRGITV